MSQLIPIESELVASRRGSGRLPSRQASLDIIPAVLMVAHAPLGLILEASSGLARLHGLATAGIVIGGALFFKRLPLIIYGVVYLASAGVLWRMTEAEVPWEISKHSLSLVSVIVLVRFRKRIPDPLPLLYFVLLLPAAAISIIELGVVSGRTTIVFNLSGPLALAFGVAMFSSLRLELHDIRRITYMVMAPVAAIWAIALQSVLNLESFGTESSKAASGGFGPNQVSTILGFGALVAIVWAMRETAFLHRAIVAVVGVAFLVQSMLTFSRAGLFNVAVALVFVAFAYVRRPSRIVAAALVGLLLASLSGAVLGQLDEFTGGKLLERFSEANVTGRDEIAEADLAVWKQAPITGVGPGRSQFFREGTRSGANAHTEFTRLLAEHGVLGLLAIVTLGIMAVRHVSDRRELWELAWSLALMAWAAAAMMNASMRVGAISLAFALSSARLVPTVARDAMAHERQPPGTAVS